MTWIRKLLGRSRPAPSTPRTKVCWECGMPVDDHKDWCSIFVESERRGDRQDASAA